MTDEVRGMLDGNEPFDGDVLDCDDDDDDGDGFCIANDDCFHTGGFCNGGGLGGGGGGGGSGGCGGGVCISEFSLDDEDSRKLSRKMPLSPALSSNASEEQRKSSCCCKASISLEYSRDNCRRSLISY